MVYDPTYGCVRDPNPRKRDEASWREMELMRKALEAELRRFTFVCADCKEKIKEAHGLLDFRNADGKRICGTCHYTEGSDDGARVEIQRELATEAALPIVRRGNLRFMIGLQRNGKFVWATK
jgi:hypothetical protein